MFAAAAALILASCGGGSGDNGPQPTTGTIAILFTDRPTDEFSEIKLNVTEAILIGGGNSQQVLFQGAEPIDLLDLTNYSEPVSFGEVKVGTYAKIRLIVDSIELVPVGGGDPIYAKVVANGKVDLLQPDGFDVLPGRTVMIEIDVEGAMRMVEGTARACGIQVAE